VFQTSYGDFLLVIYLLIQKSSVNDTNYSLEMALIVEGVYNWINNFYPSYELSIKLCGVLKLNHLMLTLGGKLGLSCNFFGNIPEKIFASCLSDREATSINVHLQKLTSTFTEENFCICTFTEAIHFHKCIFMEV